jgi:spore maturation protein CgeB
MKRKILLILPLGGGSLIAGHHVADALKTMEDVSVAIFSCQSLLDFYGKSFGHVGDPIQRNRLILEHVNLSALGAVADFQPQLILVMALAPIAPSFLPAARRFGAVTVHWYVENFRYAPSHPLVPHWRIIAPHYDFFFTIQKEPFFEELRKAGAREFHYLPTGCNPSVQRPIDRSEITNPDHLSDIGFVGSPYPNRVALFKSVPDFAIALWGPGWRDIPELKKWARGNGSLVNSRDEAAIINGAKIAVNVHSSLGDGSPVQRMDFLNPRVFTIAACGAFQLVDEQDNLPELFDPGEELATYHDADSFVSSLKEYLHAPEARQRMAEKALRRALNEHSYRKRIEHILRTTGICG